MLIANSKVKKGHLKILEEFKGKLTGIFVDEANLFYIQKEVGWKISYEKLMRYFKKECGEVKCFAYSGVDEYN